MKLRFAYDIEKDIDNYQRASKSVNHKTPTKAQALFIAKYGNVFEADLVRKFITEYRETLGMDFEAEAKRVEDGWRPIETEFVARAQIIFGIPLPFETVTGYLTTDSRYAYNIPGGYFFTSATRPRPNEIAMHELLHFWTYFVFKDHLKQNYYNDAKESLTELLNLEFKDLMAGASDDGYPQHQEIRKVVRNTWLETRSIEKTFNAAAIAAKQNS